MGREGEGKGERERERERGEERERDREKRPVKRDKENAKERERENESDRKRALQQIEAHCARGLESRQSTHAHKKERIQMRASESECEQETAI